jgi:antitoxin (DNA-binding transcriptional repressor) of toxin-antitoxin stability system
MIEVNVYEAKNRLSELLAAAERGESVRICRNGTPIVELRALPQSRNPMDADGPLRAAAGVTRDPGGIARAAADEDPDRGGTAWGIR